MEKDLWDHLQGLFQDNKDARAINLNNELRSITIGKMSINEYCPKIKSMADRLKNLGSSICEKNLVTYAMNGLDNQFFTIAKIIRHREPLPTFDTTRSMLLLEESTFDDEAGISNTLDSTSSSPIVLVTTSSSNHKALTLKITETGQACNPTIPLEIIPVACLFIIELTPTNTLAHFPLPAIEPPRTHHMVTRSQLAIVKPIDRLSLHTSSISPIPKSPFFALQDLHWCYAMHDEYNVTLSQYKARLVANGSSKQLGIDFDKTRSLYGLKQTPRAWFQRDLGLLIYLYMWMTLFLQLLLLLYFSRLLVPYTLLERPHMDNCNPYRTPVDTESKLGPEGVRFQDPTLYRSLVGGLQYLTFIHPNMMVLWILVNTYIHPPLHLLLVIQMLIGQGITNVVVETDWLRNMLRESHSPLSPTTLVYYDNVSALYLFSNPVQHQRAKHIEIDIHFVHDMVTADEVRVLHVPSHYQYVDIFTKGLPPALFEEFRSFGLLPLQLLGCISRY
ncbi:ribonuclease H-like domain-containing protein [Tanacetum coccineum]